MGIMESRDGFATAKKAMLSAGRQKILAVDSTKFDQTAFASCGDLKQIDTVVTDIKPASEWLRRFKDAGVECVYADSE